MQAHATNQSESNTPDDTRSSRHGRWWTSWQVWLSALLFAIAGAVFIVSIPITRRAEALYYLESNGVNFGFSSEDAWIVNYFGEWARPYRKVTWIWIGRMTDEKWRQTAVFTEVERLGLPCHAITQGMVERLRTLPNLKAIDLVDLGVDRVADPAALRTMQREWDISYPVVPW